MSFDWKNVIKEAEIQELSPGRTWVIQGKHNKKWTFLFGWTGGLPKFLSKYAIWYWSKGYNLVVHLAVYDVKIFKGGKGTKDGDEVKALVDYCKEELISQPEVVHSFSNGGLHQVDCFLTCWDGRDQGHALPGQFIPKHIVIDSAPGTRSVRSFGEFLLHGLGFKKRSYIALLCSYTVAVLMLLFLSFMHLFRLTQGFIKTGNLVKSRQWVKTHYGKTFRDSVHDATFYKPWRKVPRLFLFSDSDLLIPTDGIYQVMKKLKEDGTDVEFKEFQGSDHVKHAMIHSQEYWNLGESFLKE